MNTTQKVYPVTPARAATLRALLAECGAEGARVRQMPNGKARIVISSSAFQAAVRDALILADACDSCGCSFSHQGWKNAWNGPCEVFVWFSTPCETASAH